MPNDAQLEEEILDVATPDGEMAVLHKRPIGDPRARVVVFHDGPGIRNATHAFASQLALQGFDVTVPDLYHRHGRMIGYEPDERAADPSLVKHLWKLLDSLDDGEMQADFDAALKATGTAEDKFAIIGFCVGARAGFHTAMRYPDRAVACALWHPSYLVDDSETSPHLTAAGLVTPTFISIGDADTMQPFSANKLFFDAVEPLPNVKVQTFEGAEHGFTWEGWPNYNHAAATQSLSATAALFHEALN